MRQAAVDENHVVALAHHFHGSCSGCLQQVRHDLHWEGMVVARMPDPNAARRLAGCHRSRRTLEPPSDSENTSDIDVKVSFPAAASWLATAITEGIYR